MNQQLECNVYCCFALFVFFTNTLPVRVTIAISELTGIFAYRSYKRFVALIASFPARHLMNTHNDILYTYTSVQNTPCFYRVSVLVQKASVYTEPISQ